MRWTVKHGDILDAPADVLICSANCQLNLSGGVGGALLVRYGQHLQDELHAWLAGQNRRLADQGEVVVTHPVGVPYRAILHAVAVDAFYQTSATVVVDLVRKCLSIAAELQARCVALTALGTGYGRLSICEFADAIQSLPVTRFDPIENVFVCVQQAIDAEELRAKFLARVAE